MTKPIIEPLPNQSHVRCCVCAVRCHPIHNVAREVAKMAGGEAPQHTAVMVATGHWLCAVCTRIAAGAFAHEIAKGRKPRRRPPSAPRQMA